MLHVLKKLLHSGIWIVVVQVHAYLDQSRKMEKTMITRRITLSLIIMFLFCSCVPQQQQQQMAPRLVIPANNLVNRQTINQISVAVEPYRYSGQGLDYYEAGIYPLLVTLTNNSSTAVVLNPESIIGASYDGQNYLSYRPQEAIESVINSNAMNQAAKGAAAGAAVGTVAGAFVGLTLGAFFGIDPGESARAGAKAGFVGGGVGGSGTAVEKMKAEVRQEIETNALHIAIVQPGETKTGWLFFPVQISFKDIRIPVSAEGGGNSQVFMLPISQTN